MTVPPLAPLHSRAVSRDKKELTLNITAIKSSRSENSVSVKQTVVLSSLGGALEFYDFVIFVFFAVVIGKLFFPPGMPDWLRQMQTFGIFAAGYLARPLGGILLSHFGDTEGRKRIFTLSVLMMAIPTLCIGLLPTYQTAGITAPILLLLMRVLQGVAIGGEAPGGWIFVAEHARPGRVGFAVGLLTGGLTGGIFLGSLISTVLNLTLSSGQILAGGWRIPFVIGGVLGMIAMFLRRWLSETPVFEAMRSRSELSREIPLRTVLRKYKAATLLSMSSTWSLTSAIIVIILMTPSLLQTSFSLRPQSIRIANLVATAALCCSSVLVGAATDRFGVRRVAVPMYLLLMATSCALYLGVAARPGALLPLYGLAGLATGAVVITPILMVSFFKPAIRFSAISFSYNVAYAVAGGVTPLLVSWLAHIHQAAPAAYVVAATCLGVFAVTAAPSALPKGDGIGDDRAPHAYLLDRFDRDQIN